MAPKTASINSHTYYAMKKCQGSPEKLRELLYNINTINTIQPEEEPSSISNKATTDEKTSKTGKRIRGSSKSKGKQMP